MRSRTKSGECDVVKAKSAKFILFIFLLMILSVNSISNYICLSYLQDINEDLIYRECDRFTKNVRNEFEQRRKVLDTFSSRINLELYHLDYFENSDPEREYEDQKAVQECVDLLNEFAEEDVHLLIKDYSDGHYENYSRVLSKNQLSFLEEKFEYMNQGRENNYVCYQIVDMGDAFWILKLYPYYEYDFSSMDNIEYGSIMATIIIRKDQLAENLDLPQSLDVFVYDKENGYLEQGDERQSQRASAAACATKELEMNDTSYVVECVLQSGKDISGFDDIRLLVWIQLGVNIILGCLCMYALIRYIANPLNRIAKHMITIGFESKERMPGDFQCREISIVARQFNELMDRLYERNRDAFYTQQRLYEMKLCEQEREMKALQSQINPHFIYNMLENIRVLAEMGRNEDVSEITLHMAEFLRYSLYVNGFVTLADELEITECYLNIMKICYDNMFRVEYSIEEELKSVKVPKMILQPLIGNVFKHGFVFDHSDNLIRLEVKRENDCIFISVLDNGRGIGQEKQNKLNKELSASVLLERDRGFGLYSISRRIKTIYGEAYGVSVSDTEAYTKVTIVLPVPTEEE